MAGGGGAEQRGGPGGTPSSGVAGDWEANLASHPVGAVLSQAQRRRDDPH